MPFAIAFGKFLGPPEIDAGKQKGWFSDESKTTPPVRT